MEFTVVFERSQINRNCNYDLVFEPCPIWNKNGEWLINLNPESPYYQKGSVKRLIEHEGLHDIKNCIVVVHNYGEGSAKDLETLEQDLNEQKITYKVVDFK